MNIEITQSELQELLKSGLEYAQIGNKEFEMEIDRFHSEIGSINSNSRPDTYTSMLDVKIAHYVFSNYSPVFVTQEERVYGIRGNEQVLLFDAPDSKLYLEVQLLKHDQFMKGII